MSTALFAPASAATITWTGGNSNLWTDTGNWTPTGAPISTSSVIINTTTNNPVLLNANSTLSGVGGALSVGAGAGSTETLTIQNSVTLTMGARTTTLNGGTINAVGTGTFATGAGNTGGVTGFGTFSAPYPGSRTFSGTGTAGNPLILDGGNNYTGTFSGTGAGGIQFNAGSTFSGSTSGTNSTFILNGGTLGAMTLNSPTSQWQVVADTTATSTIAFNQYNTFNIGGSNGAHTMNLNGNLSTVTGGLNPFAIGVGGTLNWASASAGSMGGGGTVGMTGGAITNTGGGLFTIGDPISGNGTVTGNIALNAGSESVTGGNMTWKDVTIGSSGSGPGVNVNGNTLNLQGNITSWSWNANPQGGIVNFDGANLTAGSGTKSINNAGLTTTGTFAVINPSTFTNIAFSTGTAANLVVNAALGLQGTSTVDAANITVGSNGGFNVGTTNAITTRGSYSNGASNPNAFVYNGTVGLGPDLKMTGGTVATPVTLASGSIDLGYAPGPFTGNFALNSLTVGQTAYVGLNGPLYLGSLFGTSTTIAGTLDLMGFNAYVVGFGALMDGIYMDPTTMTLVNVVDAPVAAVPEPSTWAMMAIGFIGLGFSFRQRRRKVCFA
jgi:hypothetical protein